MTWQEIYQSKLTTADEAIKLIHDNDKIVVGFGCGEPLHIERALESHYKLSLIHISEPTRLA